MTTIEIAYSWLNKFDEQGSYLGPTVMKLVADMANAVRSKDYALAWSLIDRLPKVCEGFGNALETAEAQLACACCILNMGDTRVAVEYFKDAAARYHSSPHNRGVALWLLGRALWRLSGHENEAILAWRKSIDMFGSILKLSRFIHVEEKKWYQDRQDEMREALKSEMVSRGISSDFLTEEVISSSIAQMPSEYFWIENQAGAPVAKGIFEQLCLV